VISCKLLRSHCSLVRETSIRLRNVGDVGSTSARCRGSRHTESGLRSLTQTTAPPEASVAIKVLKPPIWSKSKKQTARIGRPGLSNLPSNRLRSLTTPFGLPLLPDENNTSPECLR